MPGSVVKDELIVCELKTTAFRKANTALSEYNSGSYRWALWTQIWSIWLLFTYKV